MKTLVVFYSLEGNTRLIAESIAAVVNADILELKPKKELNPNTFMKFFRRGKQVMMRERPELYPLDKNPQDYDILFIGTPVWASTFSPPLNTFFSNAKLAGKKIMLFCSCSGKNGNTFRNMRAALAGNDIIGETEFVEPLKSKEESAARARKWAKVLCKM